MTRYCYYNGKILPAEKICVPVTDIGFLRGFGIFDYIKVYNGIPFLMKEHLARLRRSAKIMGLTLPHSDAAITDITSKLLSKYKKPLAAVRIMLTGGPAVGGLSFDPKQQTFIILIEDLSPMPETYYRKGGILMTHNYERIFPEVKSLNYITAVKLQKEKNKRKAVEILYTHDNKILEATTSNFFLIKGKTLITPKHNILIGITRNHVIELAQKHGFTIEERDIMLSSLSDSDEAFITATNKEILPIVQVDETIIGTGKVGPNVTLLMELFQQSVHNYVQRRIKK